MSFGWSDSRRLRSSATNPTNQCDTLDDDNDSLMSGPEEEDEDGEEDDGNDGGIFKNSLKMPPYEHAKRKLSQLIGMLQRWEKS